MGAPRKPRATATPRKGATLPITEQEIAFAHHMMGHDANGDRYTLAQCANMAGLKLDQDGALALSVTARIRDYCHIYTEELARQMACQEAVRRADYELSPMAIAGEMMYLLKFGKDERARVAAGAKLLDWLGPLDDRMKRANDDDLKYLAEHGHWPEDRLLRAPKQPAPPMKAKKPEPQTIDARTPALVMEWDF
jgi:hypothetical protein